MSQILHGIYLYFKKIICCPSEIQILLSALYFYLLTYFGVIGTVSPTTGHEIPRRTLTLEV